MFEPNTIRMHAYRDMYIITLYARTAAVFEQAAMGKPNIFGGVDRAGAGPMESLWNI